MVIRLGMMQHTITGWLPPLYYVHSIRLDIMDLRPGVYRAPQYGASSDKSCAACCFIVKP